MNYASFIPEGFQDLVGRIVRAGPTKVDFHAETQPPRKADRRLCARAIDKMLLGHHTPVEAIRGLVESEARYVVAVLQEYDAFRSKLTTTMVQSVDVAAEVNNGTQEVA